MLEVQRNRRSTKVAQGHGRSDMSTGTSQGITTGVDAGPCAHRRLPADRETLRWKESTTWDAYLARVVSNIASPPVMATGAMAAVAARLSTAAAWTWAVMMVVLSVVVPLCYVLWLVKRGRHHRF